MKFSIKSGSPEKQRSSCIVTGIFESRRLSSVTEKIDKISNGYISALLRRGGLVGQSGQTLLLYHVPNILSERVLLIGCGKEREFDERQYKLTIHKTVNMLINIGSMEAIFFLTALRVKGLNIYWKVRKAIETVKETLYSFDQLKTNKIKLRRPLRKITFNTFARRELVNGKIAIQHGIAISEGVKSAKNLGNMPPNICNTSYLTSKVRQLEDYSKEHITINVVNEQQMHQLGMHAYLAVGNGSKNESLMSIIEYKNHLAKNVRPIVLIGKGITFDSGGISIKPAESMNEMKYDMCGAGAVYGVMKIIAKLKLPLNVIGILASCENMPSSHAYRPGDVLTTMSGKTVEVLNTDAEGRLILCDVLTYVERFKPETVIDIATLTGACVVALGHHITGLMSNYDPLARELMNASEQSGDPAWQLPLHIKFQEQLESNFADMTNVGGRSGGAITAGCFLSRFTSKYNWAHLDIAGTAWCSGKNKGATGRPVAMLSQFLLNRAGFNINNQ